MTEVAKGSKTDLADTSDRVSVETSAGPDPVAVAAGRVCAHGEGDLDVYFFCRDVRTGDYVVISDEPGHQGSLEVWPLVRADARSGRLWAGWSAGARRSTAPASTAYRGHCPEPVRR